MIKGLILFCASKEILIAIIGVAGTLFGTVVGWLLNFLQQKGKLNIYVNYGLNMKFETADNVPAESRDKVECFSYDIVLDIYNASGNTKIMREVEIWFYNNKDVIKKDIPKDNSKTKIEGGIFIHYDVEMINVPAKSGRQLLLHNYFWKDEMDFIWNVTFIKLHYKNEKGKAKEIVIEKKDYSKYKFEALNYDNR